MEYNVRNCLGPGSGVSIEQEFTLQTAWFDDNVYEIDDAAFGFTPPDYTGPTVAYGDGTNEKEAEWVYKRIDQLEELMNLRKPVSLDACEGGHMCSWTAEDHRRYEEWLNSEPGAVEDDPMGEMMGRNE